MCWSLERTLALACPGAIFLRFRMYFFGSLAVGLQLFLYLWLAAPLFAAGWMQEGMTRTYLLKLLTASLPIQFLVWSILALPAFFAVFQVERGRKIMQAHLAVSKKMTAEGLPALGRDELKTGQG